MSYQNPSKKYVIIFFIIWLLGNTLLVLSGTDMFRISFFRRKSILYGFLMIWSTFSLIQIYRNYRKNN